MKIAMSVMDENMKTLLDERFGRANYFVIYDLENDKQEFFENEGKYSKEGAGIVAAQEVINKEVDVLITGSLGPNAFRVLSSSGIKLYKSVSLKITEVIEKFKNNELEELKTPGRAHKGALTPGTGIKKRGNHFREDEKEHVERIETNNNRGGNKRGRQKLGRGKRGRERMNRFAR